MLTPCQDANVRKVAINLRIPELHNKKKVNAPHSPFGHVGSLNLEQIASPVSGVV